MSVLDARVVEDDGVVIGEDGASVPGPHALARESHKGSIPSCLSIPESFPLVLAILMVPVYRRHHGIPLFLRVFGKLNMTAIPSATIELDHHFSRLFSLALLVEPARRFGNPRHCHEHDRGRNEGNCEGHSPTDIGCVKADSEDDPSRDETKDVACHQTEAGHEASILFRGDFDGVDLRGIRTKDQEEKGEAPHLVAEQQEAD